MKKAVLVAILLLLGLVATYRLWLPTVFVMFGKGDVFQDTVRVLSVKTTNQILNESKKKLSAIRGHKFVVIDCYIKTKFTAMDVYDIQLVKGKAVSLGEEENVGDTVSENDFTANPIDTHGNILSGYDLTRDDFNVRLTFQVPDSSRRGYLFYWGYYWGPLEF